MSEKYRYKTWSRCIDKRFIKDNATVSRVQTESEINVANYMSYDRVEFMTISVRSTKEALFVQLFA